MIVIDHKFYSYWKNDSLTISMKTIEMKKKNSENKKEINLIKFQV